MSTDNVMGERQSFDNIEEYYLSAWARFNPESALDAGIDDYR